MTDHAHPSDDERIEAELAAALVADEETPLSGALAAKLIARGQAEVAPVVDLAARRPTGMPAWTGWAAAAAIALWAMVGRNPSQPAVVDPTPAALRTALLASAGELAWTHGPDAVADSAHGDVVWSDSAQAGVMRFHQLAANDPTKEQYQLWIFDASGDERYPVDGGVFNVAAGAQETLVRINPAIKVTKATLFVVTVERPGGVVVSDRSRVALVAKRGA
ncbi:MAG: anti-sigma factor [Gemmatimonadales bacterium]